MNNIQFAISFVLTMRQLQDAESMSSQERATYNSALNLLNLYFLGEIQPSDKQRVPLFSFDKDVEK